MPNRAQLLTVLLSIFLLVSTIYVPDNVRDFMQNKPDDTPYFEGTGAKPYIKLPIYKSGTSKASEIALFDTGAPTSSLPDDIYTSIPDTGAMTFQWGTYSESVDIKALANIGYIIGTDIMEHGKLECTPSLQMATFTPAKKDRHPNGANFVCSTSPSWKEAAGHMFGVDDLGSPSANDNFKQAMLVSNPSAIDLFASQGGLVLAHGRPFVLLPVVDASTNTVYKVPFFLDTGTSKTFMHPKYLKWMKTNLKLTVDGSRLTLFGQALDTRDTMNKGSQGNFQYNFLGMDVLKHTTFSLDFQQHDVMTAGVKVRWLSQSGGTCSSGGGGTGDTNSCSASSGYSAATSTFLDGLKQEKRAQKSQQLDLQKAQKQQMKSQMRRQGKH